MIESSNKPPGERRSSKIVARVSRSELEQLKLAAAAANRTTGRWAREVLLDASLPELPYEYDAPPRPAPAWVAEMLAEVKRIGNNLNQVVAGIHRSKNAPVDVGEVTDAVTYTEDVLAEVLEHLEQYEAVNRGEIDEPEEDEPEVEEYVPTDADMQAQLNRMLGEVEYDVMKQQVDQLKAKIRKRKRES